MPVAERPTMTDLEMLSVSPWAWKKVKVSLCRAARVEREDARMVVSSQYPMDEMMVGGWARGWG